MKKSRVRLILASIILIAAGIFITGCGNGNAVETTKFHLSQNGLDSTLTYYHDGDKVTKQTTENIIQYSSLGDGVTKEQVEAYFEPLIEPFQGVDGVEQSMDYQDDHLVEKLTIDYENADMDEVSSLPGTTLDENAKKNGVSLEESKKLLEDLGYEEVD